MLKKFFSSKKSQLLFVFFIIITLRFSPFWFSGKTLVFGDNYSLMVPGQLFTSGWMKQGVIPLWNPEVFSGIPWIANVSQSSLYPSTWFFIFFKPGTALNLAIVFHLFIAYFGMYLLSKKWKIKHEYALIAAVLWMLSTQVTGSMNNLATLRSIVWLPLIGYWSLRLVKERKARWWFSIVVFLQFLGGYPQHVLYGVGLGVLLSIWQDLVEQKGAFVSKFKTWFWSWVETAIWLIGLSAIIWIPFIDILLLSTRMQQSAKQALVGSLNPVMLIKLVIPYFWDNPRAGMKWGPAWSGQPNVAFYVTWLGLLAVGQRSWLVVKQFFQKKKVKSKFKQDTFFLVVIVATLIFSLGEYLPGFSVIQKLIPFFRIARYPSMIMIVTNVILILWVGKSLQQWRLTTKQFKWLSIGMMAIFTLSLMGIFITNSWFESLWYSLNSFVNSSFSNSPFHTIDRDKVILFEILKTALFISLTSFGILHIFYKLKTQKNSEHRNNWLMMILILGVALEVGFATQGHLFFAPKNIYNNEYQGQLKTLKNLKEKGEFDNYRLLTRNSNKPYTDYGSYWEALVVREPFSDSFVNSEELITYNHVKALRDGLTPNWNMVYGIPVINGYTTLLPQDYDQIWSTSEEAGINFIDYIDPSSKDLDQWSVKYYLVDDWFKVEEDLSSFKLLSKEDRWSLYERKALPRFRDESGASFVDLKIIKETPNKIILELNNTDNSQELIIADRWDKDWQVSINNEKRTLKNRDGMRVVEIDQGINEIQFNYIPKWFYLGLAVSLFVCLTRSLLGVRI